MENFRNIIQKMGFLPCTENTKYPKAGEAFYLENEYYEGVYWFYESESFIIDIHDFFIKKEMVTKAFPDMKPYMSFCSSYIITANGEWFDPYQNITSNSVFVTNLENNRFILHGNYPYFSVGINFKENMIAEYLLKNLKVKETKVMEVFVETREQITKLLEKLANEILHCTMESPSADIFFEAKAKEWLSITMDAYIKKKERKNISKEDEKDITLVAEYINHHFSFSISQDLLEKIAMMSGTKLKKTFKEKYKMSITEYIQRKRINMAENLLLTTGLELKDIAKSVGYSSHSRFSTLFKRYKGIYPKDVRQLKPKEHFKYSKEKMKKTCNQKTS